jgi:septum formation protein
MGTAPRRVVLASASSARLRVLHSAGLEPEVLVSGVDEDDVAGTTAEIVLELAERKARAVRATAGDALIIGCDSLLDLDGEALGKPGSPAAAAALWHRLAGRTGTLHTGQVLLDGGSGSCARRLVSSSIAFAAPHEAEIAAYVASGEPTEVAGGFTIDGRGAAFVRRVEGDPNGVLGLSSAMLRDQLAELGFALTDLWGR